jgi:hypothetical protein
VILVVRGVRELRAAAAAGVRRVAALAPPRGNFLLTCAAIAFYVLAVQRLGFLVTATVLLLALFLQLRVKPWLAVAVALAASFAIHLAFYKLLRFRCLGRAAHPLLSEANEGARGHRAAGRPAGVRPLRPQRHLLLALFGLFVGAVPGLTATMATALLVPVTFFMPPVPAVAAIVTATAMAIFSGDIPAACCAFPARPPRRPTPTRPTR